MARNEEKSQLLMNRWTQMKMDLAGPQRGKRPYLATECDNLADCEFWRRQIIKEIQKAVGAIQNAGLGEHALRDMNDDINKKIREKRHWERQIKKLGGPNYGAQQSLFDADGRAVRGGGGYLYFGATKDLPGVRELFQQEEPHQKKKQRRSRREIFRNINADYYGYRDEDDGMLLKVEAEVQQRIDSEQQQRVSRRNQHNDRKRKLSHATGAGDGAASTPGMPAVDVSSSEEEEAMGGEGRAGDAVVVGADATTSAAVRSHVPVPDQEAIEKLIIARRRLALLSKYASANLQAEEKSAKTLLNVKN